MSFCNKKDNNIRYLEDILEQESFTLEELKNAKKKHPFLCWLKGKKFWIRDWIDLKYYKGKRRIRRVINFLF